MFSLFVLPGDGEELLGRVRQLAGLAVDQPKMPRQAELRHRGGDQRAAGQFGHRAAARQERDAEVHLDGALDAVQAGQRHRDVQLLVPLLEQPQHLLAGRRRLVVRDHVLLAELAIVTCRRPASG